MSDGGRERRYAVGPGTLASLVAGRGMYRLVTLATTVLLLAVWGEQRYGRYAAALASFSWLMVLVVTGPEKTLLKLRPRAPRTGAAVSDALVAVVWWLPLPVAAGFCWALVRHGPEHSTTIHLGVAAMQISIGCTLLLVGLQRAAGRTRPDAVSFVVMSIVQLALLAAAAGAGLGPAGFAGAVIALQLVVNLALSVNLARPSLRLLRRPRLLRRLGCTALLLSAPDLYLYGTTAVLFVLLGASRHAGQLASLFVVLLVWSVGVNLLAYVLRVYAPRTSLRLAGRAGRAGRLRAARVARWVAVAGAAWLAGAGGLLVITGGAGGPVTGRLLALWVVMLAARTPVLAVLMWASFQVENTDATAPRVVALASVAGITALTLAGLVSVPGQGGAGVILAAGVGELAYALVLATRAAAGQRVVPTGNRAGAGQR